MKREYCINCLNPKVTCYCNAINCYKNTTKIIILQYPNESTHPLSTAMMAKLSFEKVEIIVGDNFSDNQFINSLCKEKTFILYPSSDSKNITSANGYNFNIETLIVLDGTWRKTYKMYQVSSNLHLFKKIAFSAFKKSHLYLRKIPKVHYLSTYESIAYAIECIEKKSFKNLKSPLKYLQDKISSYIISKGDKNEITS